MFGDEHIPAGLPAWHIEVGGEVGRSSSKSTIILRFLSLCFLSFMVVVGRMENNVEVGSYSVVLWGIWSYLRV